MNMAGLPDLIVVLSVHEDRIAVEEANRLGIPVVGVVDSNSTDEGVNFVIPGNDDSVRALALYARACADAVLSGIALQAQALPVQGAAGGDIRAPRARGNVANVTLSAKAKEVAAADEAAAAAPAAPAAAVAASV